MKDTLLFVDTKSDTDIEAFLARVLLANEEMAKKEHEIKEVEGRLKSTKRGLNEMLDTIRQRLTEAEVTRDRDKGRLEVEIKRIEDDVYEERAFLLRRIAMCSLKELLKNCPAPTIEGKEKIIYSNGFLALYETTSTNSKPVNNVSYEIRLKSSEREVGYQIEKLLKPFGQLYSDTRNDKIYLDKDFKSEDEAKKYADRNRERLTADLIQKIKEFEAEIASTPSSIDEVFDFRLDSNTEIGDERSDLLHIETKEKHDLKLRPMHHDYMESYPMDYMITVRQEGYSLKLEGIRHESQKEVIKGHVQRYFLLAQSLESSLVDTEESVKA